jgi:hypothetical protein
MNTRKLYGIYVDSEHVEIRSAADIEERYQLGHHDLEWAIEEHGRCDFLLMRPGPDKYATIVEHGDPAPTPLGGTESRYIDGDDLWEGAEPGWYWGTVEADNQLGDTTGPFASREECEAERTGQE